MFEPFPDRRPCFKRPPLPSWDEIKRITASTTMPLPAPGQRWSWWAFEDFHGGHGPKIVVCVHVMQGHEEFEARYNVPLSTYRDKVVWIVREPKRRAHRVVRRTRRERDGEVQRSGRVNADATNCTAQAAPLIGAEEK